MIQTSSEWMKPSHTADIYHGMKHPLKHATHFMEKHWYIKIVKQPQQFLQNYEEVKIN